MRISVTRDDIRVEAIRRSLDASDLDALVCALPNNVLLLSGYWPAVGTALAVATRYDDGQPFRTGVLQV